MAIFSQELITKALTGVLNDELEKAIEKQVRDNAEPIIQQAIADLKKGFVPAIESFYEFNRQTTNYVVTWRDNN